MSAGEASIIATERRARPRRTCVDPLLLPVKASVGNDLCSAPVRDISVGGIGIVFDRRVDLGTLVAIEVLNKRQNFWHLKLLRVVHVTPQGAESWIIGSAFLKQFTDDEFQELID
ncbi:MAG: PilZ domain-containing protein [Gemmataceae bacterium]|nr:PilZ domain-containing protein [Gemmataceae bacterium]